jgi:ABC-type transporter Mla MlaB component
MPLLAGLFSSLCSEPVSLRFGGVEQLMQVLRSLTPSGKRNVETAWWAVRLDVLRALHLQDEFELAALDYCVTYETAPPAWQEAACTMEVVQTPASLLAQSAMPRDLAATVPIGLDGPAPSDTIDLQGAVLGDATAALAVLDGRGHKGGHVVVNCTHLVRVDFSAAGSILNWVAKRQSDGCQVEFREVHRLLAAFFNVIGINEHARVIPRPM